MPLNAPCYTLSNAATADSLLLTNITPDANGDYSATVNVWLCRAPITASTTTSGGATTAAVLLIFGSGTLGMTGFVFQRKRTRMACWLLAILMLGGASVMIGMDVASVEASSVDPANLPACPGLGSADTAVIHTQWETSDGVTLPFNGTILSGQISTFGNSVNFSSVTDSNGEIVVSSDQGAPYQVTSLTVSRSELANYNYLLLYTSDGLGGWQLYGSQPISNLVFEPMTVTFHNGRADFLFFACAETDVSSCTGSSLPTPLATQTATPSPTPTLTPTATPSQTECRFAAPALNAEIFLAPITNNPRIAVLGSYSSEFYEFIADQMFIDYTGAVWYRVIAVVLEGFDDNQEPIVKEGAWINASAQGIPTACDLPFAYEYEVPEIPWENSQLSVWPVDFETAICSLEALQSIHTLGINPSGGSLDYPRSTHNGADLFVHDPEVFSSADYVNVFSMGTGIVVGLNGTGFTKAHDVWRGGDVTTSTVGYGLNGYAVIVRYGHLYVLYGHLAHIEEAIYVGALVQTGQPIGIQGKFNSRHSHIEVHSYGSTLPAFIDWTGILPAGSLYAAHEVIPHYVYDVMQLLSVPNGYYPSNNPDSRGENDLTYQERLATANLENDGIKSTTTINLAFSEESTVDCVIPYETKDERNSGVVTSSTDLYRGFDSYEPLFGLPSPWILPDNIPSYGGN